MCLPISEVSSEIIAYKRNFEFREMLLKGNEVVSITCKGTCLIKEGWCLLLMY